MATILPGRPPGFDRQDPERTVRELCSYGANLHEQLDFMLRTLTGRCDSLKSTLEQTGQSIQALADQTAGEQKTMTETLAALTQRVAALEALMAQGEGG